jgi:hypothetical protein
MQEERPAKRQRFTETERSLSSLMEMIGDDGQVIGVDFASSYSRFSRLYKDKKDMFLHEDYTTDDNVTNVPSSVWLSVDDDGQINRRYDVNILRKYSSKNIKYGLKKFYGLQNLTKEVIEEAKECNMNLVIRDKKLKIKLGEGVETDLDEEYELLCNHTFLKVVGSWKDKVTRVIAFSEPADYTPYKRRKFAVMILSLSRLLVENKIQTEYPRITTAFEPSALSTYYSFDGKLNVLKTHQNKTVVSIDVGGLSTDVSSIEISGNELNLKAVGGILEGGLSLNNAVAAAIRGSIPEEVYSKFTYTDYDDAKIQIMSTEDFMEINSMNVLFPSNDGPQFYKINLEKFKTYYTSFTDKVAQLSHETLAEREDWISFNVKDIRMDEEEIREKYDVYNYSPSWSEAWNQVAPDVAMNNDRIIIPRFDYILLNGPIFRGCNHFRKFVEKECASFGNTIDVVGDTAISRGLTLLGLLSVNEGSFVSPETEDADQTLHSKLDHDWKFTNVYPHSICTIYHSLFWAKDLKSAGFKIPDTVSDRKPVAMKFIDLLCGFNTPLPHKIPPFPVYGTDKDWSLDFFEVTLSGQVRLLGEVLIGGSKSELTIKLEVRGHHSIGVEIYEDNTTKLLKRTDLEFSNFVRLDVENFNPLDWNNTDNEYNEYVSASSTITLPANQQTQKKPQRYTTKQPSRTRHWYSKNNTKEKQK